MKDGSFTILVAALTRTNLASALLDSDSGPKYTLFAPKDAAFQAILQTYQVENAEDLLAASGPNLPEVLESHVVTNGAVRTEELLDGRRLRTLAGGGTQELLVRDDGSSVEVGNALLSSMVDVECSNGLIHGIDRVLTPTPAI